MKLLAAIAGGFAFYLVALWLTHRFGVTWLFITAIAVGVALSLF